MLVYRRPRNQRKEAPERRDERAWTYFSADSDLARDLVSEVESEARLGNPDPVHGTTVPEVFARSNAAFCQMAEHARSRGTAEVRDDVAFLVKHADELRESPPPLVTWPGEGSAPAEQAVRLHSELRSRLGRLAAREEQHRAEIAEIRFAAESMTALLTAAWMAKHPHPDYLGHFTVPAFAMPSDAMDIGQRAVAIALGADPSTTTQTFRINSRSTS